MITSWKDFVLAEKQKLYYQDMLRSIEEDKKKYTIYPEEKDIFNAFKYTPLENVKAVCVAQDPYHGPRQAHGLAFSVNHGIPIPPSLRNLYKELKSDLGIDPPAHGCLESWAKQGVMLLNASLTVREGQPNSHKDYWQKFTDNAIKLLNEQDRPIVFLLWGASAQKKKQFLNNPKHLLHLSAHPSPLSCAGFFGTKPFSKTNDFLVKNNLEPIDWKIS